MLQKHATETCYRNMIKTRYAIYRVDLPYKDKNSGNDSSLSPLRTFRRDD